ncbi:MAG: 3,4-dihydroxy-2-butanone-4-phosphate synthase [Myxococcales bacterium]|nr:3,4-dihydroxy-2-butanone-4-phosphate synthase [Myxococcales bacterium]
MPLQGTAEERVRRAVEAIAAGQMVILTDDEDRENEGDIVLAAEKVTPEAINFMAKHARGLICLTLTEEQIERLRLPMMVARNTASLGTAFTVSIEAREGVSTGISASDRAHTIRVAASPAAKPDDVVAPGHVFPLKARPGGVLQRTGQTEGSVDLARMAGLTPAGVICEIMNDDGSMSRMPELIQFAAEHALPIVTIEDLIQVRLQTDRIVQRVASYSFEPSGFGATWQAIVYEATVESNRQFLALVHGDVARADATLVRMHPGAVFSDLFAPQKTHDGKAPVGGGRYLFEAMHRMEAEGAGVVVYVPQNSIDFADELRALAGASALRRHDLSSNGSPAQREHGLGAQVLRDLGLQKIRLMTNNPRRLVGLAGYGLEVVEQVALGHREASAAEHFKPRS